MTMTFQTDYHDVPILFDGVTAQNDGQFAGAILVIIAIAMVFRALVFWRADLERRRWGAGCEFEMKVQERRAKVEGVPRRCTAQPWRWEREMGRLGLTLVTATIGYAIMLITMTFVVVSYALNFTVQRGSGRCANRLCRDTFLQ
jgi:hypothetical protein